MSHSVSLSGFMARRVLRGMVTPFQKDTPQSMSADKLTRRAFDLMSRNCVAALVKGTTIGCVLRLVAKHQVNAEYGI